MKLIFVYRQNNFSNHKHHKSFSLIFRLLIVFPALKVHSANVMKILINVRLPTLLTHTALASSDFGNNDSADLVDSWRLKWVIFQSHDLDTPGSALIASMVCSNPLNILMLTSSQVSRSEIFVRPYSKRFNLKPLEQASIIRCGFSDCVVKVFVNRNWL